MSSELLSVYHEHVGDQIRVHALGEIDFATAPQLDHALDEVAAMSGVRSILVNLTEVGFFSASGLTVLLNATRRGAEIGVPIVVVARPGQPAHRAITLAGLSGILMLLDSTDQDRPPRRRAIEPIKTAGDKQLSRDRA